MNRAILVKSCQKNRERHEAIWETWGDALRDQEIDVICIVGGYLRTILGDRLWALKSDDGLDNNSLKLAHALHYVAVAGVIDHLFICDDDTFIHPERWLAHEPEGEFECRLHWPQTPKEHKLNYGRPWATGGAGWWMSRRMCELYVEQVKERCSWDDVLAARVAQDNDVRIVDRPDLYLCNRYSAAARWDIAEDSRSRMITCHPVEPGQMVRLYEATRGR